MEENKLKWRSWGKQPNETMPHQWDPEECPRCQHKESRTFFYEYLVGFSDKPEDRTSMYEEDREGMIVLECPKCFTLFKRHLHHSGMFLFNGRIKHNPDFLEVPGAKEAFLKMLGEVKGDK